MTTGAVRGERRYDAIVIGAGPAGCSAALWMARAGLRVLVLDKALRGRDKACGEGLMPRGVAALARAGLERLVDGAPEFAGIALGAGGRRGAGRFRVGAGRGVRRDRFDERLAEAAAWAGAELRFGARADTVSPRGLGCAVHVGHEQVEAPIVLVADGGRSVLSRRLAARGRRDRDGRDEGPGRVGVVAHAPLLAPMPLVEARFGDGFQVVLTQVADDTVSIAALVAPSRARELAAGPASWLCARLVELGLGEAGAIGLSELSRPRCVPLLGPWRSVDEAARGRVLLVGDAAGAVDPIVGCGISLALESGEQAGDAVRRALDGSDPDRRAVHRFDRLRRRALRLPRAVAGMALALGRRPRRARVSAAVLAHVEPIASALVSAVGGA